MRIIICKDYTAMGAAAATIIGAQVLLKPNSAIGLATGSTPLSTYAAMINMANSGTVDFSEMRTFNLDEYYGLPGDHEQSYKRFMQENLFSKLPVKGENTHIPDGMAGDAAAECGRYERLIEENGGIDLQLLGIGRNGHIGFNEPDGVFSSKTHVQALTDSTIEANKRFFASADDVPKQALTMGIQTIMNARRILLLASGADKAEAIRDTINGDINPLLPGSILQAHNDCIFILDAAAASLL